jgi:hypothetical protein
VVIFVFRLRWALCIFLFNSLTIFITGFQVKHPLKGERVAPSPRSLNEDVAILDTNELPLFPEVSVSLFCHVSNGNHWMFYYCLFIKRDQIWTICLSKNNHTNILISYEGCLKVMIAPPKQLMRVWAAAEIKNLHLTW